jgi:hypothetical protein
VERPRIRSRQVPPLVRPEAERRVPPRTFLNTGVIASAAWLVARDVLPAETRWSVEIALATSDDRARFAIEIFAEEWGISFRLDDRTSWIRVTDVPFVHGRDDFELLRRTPRLEALGTLMRALEEEHGVRFVREKPSVISSFGCEDVISAWAKSL